MNREATMKNDDQQQLKHLLSIFTGYQLGVALAVLLGILVVTLSFLPGAVIPLIILVIVIIVPYFFVRK